MKTATYTELYDSWAEDMTLDIYIAVERVGIEFAEAMDKVISDVFDNRKVQHLFDVYLEYNYDRIDIEDNTYYLAKSEDTP